MRWRIEDMAKLSLNRDPIRADEPVSVELRQRPRRLTRTGNHPINSAAAHTKAAANNAERDDTLPLLHTKKY